jgi:phosphopantetheine adenylyltransferase
MSYTISRRSNGKLNMALYRQAAVVVGILVAVGASSSLSFVAASFSLALLVPPPPQSHRLRQTSSSCNSLHDVSANDFTFTLRRVCGGGVIILQASSSLGNTDDDLSTQIQARQTTTSPTPNIKKRRHDHTLAILTMPQSASARIANEAILETAMSVTSRKLSVVLRATSGEGVGRRYDDDNVDESKTAKYDGVVSLTQLRRYAGEVYSMAWDAAFGLDERERSVNSVNDDDDVSDNKIATGGQLLDLIVYPQNMPNSPPEGWIDLRPDLSCVCSHDSITGWVTPDSRIGGSGRSIGGGLRDHVDAVNAKRTSRGLGLLEVLHVNDWPDGAEVTGDPNVVFLEDDDAFDKTMSSSSLSSSIEKKRRKSSDNEDTEMDGSIGPGGTAIPSASLYSSVCVGGTFDGMHYGHRKLLTLAISSVQPVSGRLLIGVTRDEMLQHKAFAERIPPMDERIAGVLDFVGNLAPGMKNRIRCIPISDEYGPPGQPLDSGVYPGLNDFDALVLSHETLPTGRKLNMYREGVLGLRALKLLCTQRTEPHGMSSTALRRMRTTKQ